MITFISDRHLCGLVVESDLFSSSIGGRELETVLEICLSPGFDKKKSFLCHLSFKS